MTEDQLNRALANESIVPSSGFAANVMERVRAQAGAPEPIRFPWRRGVRGLVICGVALIVLAAFLLEGPADASASGLSKEAFATAFAFYSVLVAAACVVITSAIGRIGRIR